MLARGVDVLAGVIWQDWVNDIVNHQIDKVTVHQAARRAA